MSPFHTLVLARNPPNGGSHLADALHTLAELRPGEKWKRGSWTTLWTYPGTTTSSRKRPTSSCASWPCATRTHARSRAAKSTRPLGSPVGCGRSIYYRGVERAHETPGDGNR